MTQDSIQTLEKSYIKIYGVLKTDGEPFIALSNEIALPVVKNTDTGKWKAESTSDTVISLTDFLEEFTDVENDSGEALSTVFFTGYYNESNGNFYLDPDFNTPMYQEGEIANEIPFYVDLSRNFLYRYDNGEFKAIGVAKVIPDFNQTDEDAPDYIKNKPTKLSQFENDEAFLSETEIDSKLTNILKNYATIDASNKTYAYRSDLENLKGRISSVYRIKGSVDNYDELMKKSLTASEGDVWNVHETGKNYVWVIPETWNGETPHPEGGWDDISGIIDISPLNEKIAELEAKLEKKQNTATGEEIASIINTDTVGIYLCSETFLDSKNERNFEMGYIYYVNKDIKNGYTIISSGGTGSANVAVQSSFKTVSVRTDESVIIPYSWFSSNSGYGKVTLRVDGMIVEERREMPHDDEYNFTLSPLTRGSHTISISAVDSAGYSGAKWNYTLLVGSLELSSIFNDSILVESGKITLNPYTVYAAQSADINLTISVNNEEKVNKVVSAGSDFYNFSPDSAGKQSQTFICLFLAPNQATPHNE